MKTKLSSIAPVLLALCLLNSPLTTLHAQGTAFTYQGRLQNNGSPAGGIYNLAFRLFATNATGVPVAGPVTNNGVVVSNGLFTVQVDFGSGAFTGQSNWLEIAVATNLTSSFTTLAPRQQVTPAPYAIYAESASGLSGALPASQLSSVGNNNGGVGNFFVGPAGNAVASGSDNTALGSVALNDNTSGSDNTANGFGALYFNSVGFGNTAVGYEALINNHTGSNNIALGYLAGFNLNTGSSNIDIGNQGLSTDTNIIRIGSGQSQTFIAGVVTATSFQSGSFQNDSSGDFAAGSGNTAAGGPFFPLGNAVGGGENNTASGGLATVGGGELNTASWSFTVVGGGYENRASAGTSTVGGGFENTASGQDATVGGGDGNIASNEGATVPGGDGNTASGQDSFAAGQQARALHQGAFVWADSQNATFSSTTNDQFLIRAHGGVGIGTGSPEQALSVVGGMNVDAGNANNGPAGSSGFNQGGPTNGCLTFGTSSTGTGFSGEGIQSKRTSGGSQYDLEFFTGFNNRMTIFNNGNFFLNGNVGIGTNNPSVALEVSSAASANYNLFQIESSSSGTSKVIFDVNGYGDCYAATYNTLSDRNAKEDFTSLDAKEVLAKVISLPVSEWNYKNHSADTRHIGPMAQDFHAAFGLNGADDKHISVVDEGGVALAAIQGLNEKLEARSEQLEAENAELKQSVAELKQLVQTLADRR